ncbi:MAG: tetratricopeptide repeat protein, partial [Bacteroidota bacterium]
MKSIFCFEPIKARVILGFFVLTSLAAQSQTQVALDSLEKKYQSRELEPQAKLAILKELAINSTDTNKKLSFSEELVRVATLFDSTNYLIQGLQEKGNALRLKGDLTRALQSFLQAAKLVEEKKGKAKLGALNIGIADVYSVMGNYSNAVSYYRHAIEILRTVNDSTNMAAALLNMGDTYITMHKWDSALICTEEAGVIYEKIQSKIGEAYSLGNLGMIYVQLGDDKKAERIMNKAIELLEVLNEYYPISV